MVGYIDFRYTDFNPDTAIIGDVFWGACLHRYEVHPFNRRITALNFVLNSRNIFFKRILDDYEISKTTNTRKSRKRTQNYCRTRKNELNKYNLKFYDLKSLALFAEKNYVNDNRYEVIYPEYKEFCKNDLIDLTRTWARVIMNAPLLEKSSELKKVQNKNYEEFFTFFKVFCGLRKQIGTILISYHSFLKY
jgi:hypothetical protein